MITQYESQPPYGSYQKNTSDTHITEKPHILACEEVLQPTVKTQQAQFHGRSASDGMWFAMNETNFELYAYSAFYDDCLSLKSLPCLRIIIVCQKLEDNPHIHLHCKIAYRKENTSIVQPARKLDIGFGVFHHGKWFKEYVLTCDLPAEQIPMEVGIILSNSTMALPQFWMPIEVPFRPYPQHEKQDFGACVAVSYLYFNPVRIVEWMEIQRLLGVSKVTVYNNSLEKQTSDVFRHYDSQGFVDFRQSHNFVKVEHETTYHLHVSPVINDCIYRNMHRFRKIAVIDLDEFIIPQSQSNLKDMLFEIETIQGKPYHPARTYAFRNTYFFLDHPDVTQPEYLMTLRQRTHVPPSDQGYSPKSIIDPQACTNMHAHYCWGFTPLYDTELRMLEVDPSLARSQHYKKCHFDKNECEKLLGNRTECDVMLKLFKSVVDKPVQRQLRELGLLRSDGELAV